MREIIKGMTKKEIIVDCLHIAWYLLWRLAAVTVGFLGSMYALSLLDEVL